MKQEPSEAECRQPRRRRLFATEWAAPLLAVCLLLCGAIFIQLQVSPIGALVSVKNTKTSSSSNTTKANDDDDDDDDDEYGRQALRKNSSLRFDWTNLPPMTPLGRAMERVQSQCLNATAEPQEIVLFNLIPSGMGSSLHTWMNPLCHATIENRVLITGGRHWSWNDAMMCPGEIQRQSAARSSDSNQPLSSLWCYFGWHESALRCPPGTVAWNKSVTDYKHDWGAYKCDKYHDDYGRGGVLSAAAEWLFQNVSQLVIREAERQIREEAFPIDNTTVSSMSSEGFQRWPGIPTADSLITVHIRWGDKAVEMELVSMEEIINGTKSLLTADELAGRKVVHVYLATEDPAALKQFREAAMPNWRVHSSGPKNPSSGKFNMMSAALKSRGRAGLQSLAALLISLEANRYVLATGSNWSRLINELRKSVVDSRCGNCTQMLDVRYGEVRM